MDNGWWLWNAVWPNLLSDLIFSILVSLILVVLGRAVITRRRKKLFAFFGVDPQSPVVRIFVSRMTVAPNGSIGVDGRLPKAFTGEALMKREYDGAQKICAQFTEELLEILPKFLRDAIRNPYLGNVKLRVDVSPAEGDRSLLSGPHLTGTVVLGSDVYNHFVRKVYERNEVTFVRFVGEKTGQIFNASQENKEEPTFAIQLAGDFHPIGARERAGREIGTVQRITMDGRRILMCAGISSSSTFGAAEYVAEHWAQLHEKFGDQDFLVTLQFRGQGADKDLFAKGEPLDDYERKRPPAMSTRA